MRMPATESRLSPLEFVDTLGDLYQSAHASPAAVSVAYRRFRMSLSRKLSIPPKAKLPEIARLAGTRFGWPEEALLDTLARSERAMRNINLDEAEALYVVRQLHEFSARLEPKGRADQETVCMAMTAAELAAHVRKEFSKVIVGQTDAVDQMLVVILTGGHALIEGVPGLAKTLAVKCLAHLFNLQFQRVQCTPDLIPADILGGNIFQPSDGTFRMNRGPVFTDLLLVDEINRMPPRTQSALLEAMEEFQVTIDGVSYPLSRSFAVFATQNPVEFEGTYPLPEAQLDRFLMKIRIGYPEAGQESEILSRYQGGFEARDLDRRGTGEAVQGGAGSGPGGSGARAG